MEITREEFNTYENVRLSGVTNMMAVKTVAALSGLDVETIKNIMRNYGALTDKYASLIKSEEV